MGIINTNEDFRQFVMEYGLPVTEITLFGVKCPYCGKSEQIRKLESPEELSHVIEADKLSDYSGYLKRMEQPGLDIGVCRFCRNCLGLNKAGQAVPLLEI